VGEVNLYNPANAERKAKVSLLVDTGDLLTSVPGELLQGLELKPLERRSLRVYVGTIVERDIGGAVMQHQDHRATVPVIFGEPHDTPILGVSALESLGYELDAVTEKLKPVELLMI